MERGKLASGGIGLGPMSSKHLQGAQALTYKSRARRHLACAALLLTGFSSSCQDTAVASSNLDALLDTNNHLSHYAVVMPAWKYYLSSVLEVSFNQSLKSESAIGDPAYVALENLIDLSKGRGVRDAHRQVIQVRQFTRFALRSPGLLVRERAILELSSHAKRLGLKDVSEIVDPSAELGPIANAADLSTLMAGLIETLEPVLFESSGASKTQHTDFALACEQFDENRIELDGLWRVLKAIETFAARVDIQRASLSPLLDLSERLQRRSVALAFAGTAIDPSPRVRSASLQASFEAFGHPVLQEALNLLRRNQPEEYHSKFGLAGPYIVEDTVASTLFSLLATEGWPHLGLPDSLEFRENRFQDLRSALTIVHNTAEFHSATRCKAMQALVALMPEGPDSLREEKWTDWWEGWSRTELRQLEELTEKANELPGTPRP